MGYMHREDCTETKLRMPESPAFQLLADQAVADAVVRAVIAFEEEPAAPDASSGPVPGGSGASSKHFG